MRIRSAAWLVVSLLVSLLVACEGFTKPPKPTPTKPRVTPDPDAPADAEPRELPKFDVAPPGPTRRPTPAPAPKGFVALGELDPSLRLDMRYATADNFTGAPLPGDLPGAAWLRQDAADALSKVQADLAPDGLGLLVYDAYRPRRAVKAMVAWAQKSKPEVLEQGYVAKDSMHTRGHAVDLTLVELATGKELEMGTAWDTFSTASHYANAEGPAMDNRKRLRAAMVRRGFRPYEREWWHFDYPTEPPPPAIDIPYTEIQP